MTTTAELTPQERRRTLVGAGLGWTFDGFETYALILTLGASLPALLPGEDPARLPFFAGVTIALTLFGFGVGGIVGGVVADRFGRRRTMMVTVCAYAALTGLSALAWDWWSFVVLRLLTGAALGAEWSTGAALVAETWPDRLRSRAAAVMQSGIAVGLFAAAAAWFVLGPLGPDSWRWMFLIGVVPALVTLVVRRHLPMSPAWVASHRSETARGSVASPTATVRRILGDPALRRITLVTSLMSLATTLGWWGVSTFVPQYFASVAVPAGWEAARATSVSGMVYTAGAVVGYLLFGALAEWWGRRPATAVFFALGFLLTPVVFVWTHTVPALLVLLFVNGAFTLGQYCWMAVWLPELYPTSVRATGIALVFNASRLLACIGPVVAGSLIVALGGFGTTASVLACVYLLGLALVWFCPETRGRPLPRGEPSRRGLGLGRGPRPTGGRRRRSPMSMTRREAAAPVWSSSASSPTRVMSAFHNAHPRPRAQVPASRSSRRFQASRAGPVSSVQASTVSHAGSPTPQVPKSMTAARRPSRTSRLPPATSPWNHTGGAVTGAASAASHTRRAPSWSTSSPSAAKAFSVSSA